jgi:8-oxo-dGTP pyrophosphatase MutT (NUDIX family)
MSFIRTKSAGAHKARQEESPQFAALCYRKSGNATKILLITSRDTGRWVIPKGWPVDGMTGAEAAMREAFEEAGAKGRIISEPIGDYRYLKRIGANETLPCRVTVYPMCVEKMLRDFPEKGQRNLKWFNPLKAAEKVQEPELQGILQQFRAPEEGSARV